MPLSLIPQNAQRGPREAKVRGVGGTRCGRYEVGGTRYERCSLAEWGGCTLHTMARERSNNKDVPTSGWRFSSCAPCSAFVDGVNTGSGSFWDSTSPSGIFIPCIVPLFLYSDQADPARTQQKLPLVSFCVTRQPKRKSVPVIYPRTIASSGTI